MRLLTTALFPSLLAAGFASAECYSSSMSRGLGTIPWELKVYSGANCTGYPRETFTDELAVSFFGDCNDCYDMAKKINDDVASFVFSTPDSQWEPKPKNTETIAQIFFYKDAGCRNQIGKSKGSWTKSHTSKKGMKMSSFQVCYEPLHDLSLGNL
ncbi:hypothetical protein BV22DRAFT_689413 [Leucogyrophana mollusca]|uniref:Uncharacterized protein n=1 Tax=Leucogyrophana mollusca TaxID=85980 RepID=A0ACB8B9L5_9AGAM|nr:hypothetical protein BV22DRAFT_689413 [Leucogyrophana mollusca]